MNPLIQQPVSPGQMMPQGQPTGVPGPQMAPQASDPAMLQQAHKTLGVITDGLMGLIAKQPGTLDKQDVLGAAADMIKAGAFPDQPGRQALITELAQLPDDEGAIRQFLGQHLMTLADAHAQLGAHLAGAAPNG